MAIFSLSDFQSQLPVVYRELVPQIQRRCPTLRLMSQIGRLKPNLTGDQMRWIPRFNGQVSGAVNTDGGNLLSAAADQRKEAALAFGTYSAPVQVTDKARRLAQPNAGVPAEFNPFGMLVQQNVMEAAEVLLKNLEQDIYAGTGSSNTVTGLPTIISNTGQYAGVNSATYGNWVSTVDGNGGALRNLTLALMKKNNRIIGAAAAAGRPDLYFCTGALFDSVEALFDAYSRIVYSADAGSAVPTGTQERVTMNPATLNIAGGQIRADGFRVLHWQSQGIYFVEAPDCQDPAATNPANAMIIINSADVDVAYPPLAVQDAPYQTPVQGITPVEQGLGPLETLPFEMIPRGRTKAAFEWDLFVYFGLKLRSRNAHGKLLDVQ